MRSRQLSLQEIEEVAGAAYSGPVEIGGPFPLVPAPPCPAPLPGPGGNRPRELDDFNP